MSDMSITKAEQETIVRWDQDERVLHLWTTFAPQARQWARLGYPIEVRSRAAAGALHAWSARVPLAVLRWRRLRPDGATGRPRGRPWRSASAD